MEEPPLARVPLIVASPGASALYPGSAEPVAVVDAGPVPRTDLRVVDVGVDRGEDEHQPAEDGTYDKKGEGRGGGGGV